MAPHTHKHMQLNIISHYLQIYVRMYVIKHPLLATSYIYNVHIVHSARAVEMCTNIKYVTSTNVWQFKCTYFYTEIVCVLYYYNYVHV